MAQIVGYDPDSGAPMYMGPDGSFTLENPDAGPLSGAALAQDIYNRTGKNVQQTMEEARRMFEQSGIRQAYPNVTFEKYLELHGINPIDVDGTQWASYPTKEFNWGLGTQTNLGEALKMAGLAFGGMAGLNGLGLLGGGEAALAGAGGGGAAEIASLAELPGFGGVGEIGAAASGATTFPLETLPMPQGTPLPPVDGVSNLPMPPGTPPPAPVDIPGGLPGMSPTPPLPGQTGPTLPTIPGGTGTVIDGVPPVATGGAAAGGFSSFLKDVLGISNEANIPRSLIDLLGGVYSAYSQNQTAGDYENFTKSYLDRAFPQATTNEQIGWAGVSKDMRTNGDFWKNNSLMNQIGQTAANKAERQAAAQGYNLSSNALQSMYRDSYDAMASKFALPYMEQVSRNAGLQKASPDAFASSMASNIYKNDQQTQGTIGNVIKTGVNTVLGKP